MIDGGIATGFLDGMRLGQGRRAEEQRMQSQREEGDYLRQARPLQLEHAGLTNQGLRQSNEFNRQHDPLRLEKAGLDVKNTEQQMDIRAAEEAHNALLRPYQEEAAKLDNDAKRKALTASDLEMRLKQLELQKSQVARSSATRKQSLDDTVEQGHALAAVHTTLKRDPSMAPIIARQLVASGLFPLIEDLRITPNAKGDLEWHQLMDGKWEMLSWDQLGEVATYKKSIKGLPADEYKTIKGENGEIYEERNGQVTAVVRSGETGPAQYSPVIGRPTGGDGMDTVGGVGGGGDVTVDEYIAAAKTMPAFAHLSEGSLRELYTAKYGEVTPTDNPPPDDASGGLPTGPSERNERAGQRSSVFGSSGGPGHSGRPASQQERLGQRATMSAIKAAKVSPQVRDRLLKKLANGKKPSRSDLTQAIDNADIRANRKRLIQLRKRLYPKNNYTIDDASA